MGAVRDVSSATTVVVRSMSHLKKGSAGLPLPGHHTPGDRAGMEMGAVRGVAEVLARDVAKMVIWGRADTLGPRQNDLCQTHNSRHPSYAAGSSSRCERRARKGHSGRSRHCAKYYTSNHAQAFMHKHPAPMQCSHPPFIWRPTIVRQERAVPNFAVQQPRS